MEYKCLKCEAEFDVKCPHCGARALVPIDGSDLSIHALGYAMESARKWSAELEIVSMIPPVARARTPTEMR